MSGLSLYANLDVQCGMDCSITQSLAMKSFYGCKYDRVSWRRSENVCMPINESGLDLNLTFLN